VHLAITRTSKLARWPRNYGGFHGTASWNFLTSQARGPLRIAQAPGARRRDIAAGLGITERRAYSIVTDLADVGYVVKHKDGRRNRDQVQAHLPRPDPPDREPVIGEVLAVLIGEAAAAS
jgi:hypothetical protein